MHSSRMRTGRSITVWCSLLPGGLCLVQGGSAPGGSAPGGVPGPGGVCSQGGGVPGLGGGVSA